MKPKSLAWVMGMTILAAPLAARAAEYYVAPTGSDSAAGTMAAPFATVERGQQAASAGDTVCIRGGVYMFSGTQRHDAVSRSARAAARTTRSTTSPTRARRRSSICST